MAALSVACSGAPPEPGDLSTAAQGVQINQTMMYALRNVATGKCVDVPFSSLADAARIQLWDCNGTHAQHFYFRAAGNGNYALHNVNSDKCLDVAGASQSGGAGLIQYHCTGGANQTWQPSDAGNGAVTLTVQHSGQAMDVSGGNSDNGTAIIQWPLHGAQNQQFVLEPVQPVSVNPVQVPIKHVIIIVKENHTFDNYFGSYPGVDGTLGADGQNLCDTPQGRVPCAHAPDTPKHDMDHGHASGLIDWDGGKMDGWSKPGGSDTGDGQSYAQYNESDIPNYWAYARHFVLGDHFYANMIGPSFPGHFFTVAAQAGWATGNPPTDLPSKISGFPPKFYGPSPFWGCDEWPGDTVQILANGTTARNVFPCFNVPSLPDVLPSGTSWKFYGTNFDGFFSENWSLFDAVSTVRNNPAKWANIVNESQFSKDIQNHTLPNVTWLIDQDQYSEHPDLALPGLNLPLGGVCLGEGWTVKYVNQIMQSEYWNSTAILFTMDDYGGWRDHVPPPRQYGGTAAEPYGLGFRLPLMIISPYAKPGFVFHEVAEQASMLRFVERIFGSSSTLSDLDPAAQDGQANDLLGAFDFNQTPLAPLVLTPRTCPL
jgi:phospholipase C